jgi:hypothetical protein
MFCNWILTDPTFTALIIQSKVIKYLDEIEERLITEVESVQEKNEEKINKEKHDIMAIRETSSTA